jgi:hypothetical protein
VAEVFAKGIEATVPATVRHTVDAVSSLKENEVSLDELAAKSGWTKAPPVAGCRTQPRQPH